MICPAAGIETPISFATSGSSPMIANSPVPMPNPPTANATSARRARRIESVRGLAGSSATGVIRYLVEKAWLKALEQNAPGRIAPSQLQHKAYVTDSMLFSPPCDYIIHRELIIISRASYPRPLRDQRANLLTDTDIDTGRGQGTN